MRLHFDPASSRTLVSAYGAGFVVVNETRYTASIIAYPDRVLPHWGPRHVDELNAGKLEPLFEDGAEIVLIGTGRRQRFPSNAVLAPLYDRRVGIEIMDTFAACRTFNVLASENRVVVAGLMID